MDAKRDDQTTKVFCFGEALWDVLPDGMYPGGAPINVAYHLNRLGVEAVPITAVGRDELGTRMLEQMRAWNLETRGVSVIAGKSTGVVKANPQKDGSVKYEIVEGVAWDWIYIPREVKAEVLQPDAALVYGTLAARLPANRIQLMRLLGVINKGWKIYDVNLRPPYDDHALVWELARRADLIKLNESELRALTVQPEAPLAEAAARFAEGSACPRICVTAAERGAGLWLDGAWHWTDAQMIATQDTVGAGDAFLASLIADFLRAKKIADPQATLTRANRLGAFVAASHGATPLYTIAPTGEITSL